MAKIDNVLEEWEKCNDILFARMSKQLGAGGKLPPIQTKEAITQNGVELSVKKLKGICNCGPTGKAHLRA